MPKLEPEQIEKLKENSFEQNIADVLSIDISQVNIKATTEEGLGFTGNGEGISSQAICLLNGFYEGSMAVGGNCSGCGGCTKQINS